MLRGKLLGQEDCWSKITFQGHCFACILCCAQAEFVVAQSSQDMGASAVLKAHAEGLCIRTDAAEEHQRGC